MTQPQHFHDLSNIKHHRFKLSMRRYPLSLYKQSLSIIAKFPEWHVRGERGCYLKPKLLASLARLKPTHKKNWSKTQKGAMIPSLDIIDPSEKVTILKLLAIY